jgi:hypothetical protein
MGFRDRAAHDRAHELWATPAWHPDAPTGAMRHMLRMALKRCLNDPGFCDYEARVATDQALRAPVQQQPPRQSRGATRERAD